MKTQGCQGPECRDGILHKSDCAIHNGDALPVGPCDCGAAPSAQDSAAPSSLSAEHDVRTILLEVVPGDGDGMEVYAKSVKDVEEVLSRMGEELEEWQLGMRRLPAPPAPAAAPQAGEPEAPSDDEQLVATLIHCARAASPEAVTGYDLSSVLNRAAERIQALAQPQPGTGSE